jgi:hypothetical protein
MLVYGDQADHRTAGDQAARVQGAWLSAHQTPPGLARHAFLVETLVEAGKWLQGLADAQAAERGHDHPTPEQDAGGRILRAIADAVLRSWTGGFARELDRRQSPEGLLALAPETPLSLRGP